MTAHAPLARRLKLKRVYQPPSKDDGMRVLVDRLWPRGLRKEEAAIDHWIKEVAPSNELRRWFGHDPERWVEFRRRYREELRHHGPELERIRELAKEGTVTLLFGAHDEERNNAVVLRETLVEGVGT
jgi:uncharacterized protein YeaO (DUF488 family)